MTSLTDLPDAPPAADPFGALPELRVEPDARARIRAAHRRRGRRIAVLDDDPTGSQTVHDVAVVTGLDAEELDTALAEPASTCFVLTNTRSLPEADAVQLNHRAGRLLADVAERRGGPVAIISRSDSTLRGHVVAEGRALDAAHRAATGRGYDGVLLAPAYLEAGRCTVGDVHWARVGGRPVPAGETEFARDATFGYTASRLPEFLAERSDGAIDARDVCSIGLHDIRAGGVARVAEILGGVTDGRFVVVNATDYADLEIVVLGALEAEEAGARFLYRTGPSFVRAFAGLEPRAPLTSADLWPAGRPVGHGLVVAGSHVALTCRQLVAARAAGGLSEIELDVGAVVDPDRCAAHVADAARRVAAELQISDVLLSTTRTLARGEDAAASLRIARAVSAALVDVVHRARAARPAWVIAKGGITSHDIAAHGLGIRRAAVLGQLLPGLVTVLRPERAAQEALGTPFVVFAGNVGDDTTLAFVINLLRGNA
jgi:uncharacterized protein YgbK (DUF1537 family)